MLLLFPPGDTSWKNTQPQSAWREFNFAYNQLKRAVEPHLALEDMIAEWNGIAKLLAERPRKRNTQISQHYLFE
jgi:hypothetical protein